VIHDLKVPLLLIVGVRSWYLHQDGKSTDSCPVYTEPILRAWNVPYVLLDRRHSAADLAATFQRAQAEKRPAAVLIAE
jgi:hypothetical protein